jgi:hypothetical protein
MWEFIAFIILVAIIFGISLHEAFWGIITFVAIVCGVACIFGFVVGTKTGREVAKWVALGLCCLMIYFGLSNELKDGYFDMFSWSSIEAYVGILGCGILATMFGDKTKKH